MTTVTETLTIHLPEAAARRLRRVAEISGRPLDEVVAETLCAGLPPLLEDVPPAFREDLAILETLSTAELWEQLRTRAAPEHLARYDALLADNAAGKLDAAGREELAALRMEADRIMFRKAYAALLLKWRGQCIPSSDDLDREP